MIEVAPLDLIPGKKYYLEQKGLKSYRQDLGFSTSAIGTFVKYSQTHHGIFAEFKNIKSVNKKPTDFLDPHSDLFTFHVAPYGSGFKIYKATRDSILARKDKEIRIKAVENMINSQYPYLEDVISTSNMFSEEPYVPPSTYPPTYEETSRKTDVGHHLSSQIGKYFGGKTLKSKKSKKSKSRRRQ
jgi:hypothetical protein